MTQRPSGKVFLVGAGPGHPDLITRRALDCLAQADVVVYDHLANPLLLEAAPKEAERVYVGKTAGHHTLTQDEINALLVDRARAGRTVVRLKGGDPFVFGRGGEEALVLAREGIAFEIVPGVTSAVAVPAFAGIPVTHRGKAVSFHVFTAHEADDKNESALDWQTIAKLEGTLVFLMGVSTLARVAHQLVSHGRPPDTPVAVIRWGSTPEQVTIVGTLQDIAEKVEAARLAPPAVTVVGRVVELREALRWFEFLPLFGHRIALTRPAEQSEELAQALRRAGADVVITPTIAIRPRPLDESIRTELLRLHAYQWVIFTSANGVNIFFDYLDRLGLDARALSESRIAAIGDKTAQVLRQRGIRADVVPGRFVQEALADALPVQPHDRVLVPRAAVARDALERQLTQRGAKVHILPVYDTLPNPDGIRLLRNELDAKRVTVVTFTSASTVESLAESLSREELANLFSGVGIASIGPLTSAAVRKIGLAVSVEASVHTAAHLAQAIIEHFQTQSQDFSLKN